MLTTPLVQQVGNAQATTAAGAIQGVVTDPGGAALPGASITITNLATGAKRALETDSAGFYSVASLTPGKYQIDATAQGFATTTTTFTVQIGTTTNGDLRLKLGSASEQVVVSTEAIQVNSVQSTVEGVLTEQQIDNLPISGRNFLDLSQLEPGVQLQSGESFDPTKAGYSSISVNGVNGRTARILLDGQDISDETVGTTTLNVSQGSIEEFQISRSSLDISNELTSSGAVAVSTHSGTNQYHGQGFGLFRDERAGAADAPGGTDYPFQRNQFGGRLGGPVLKNKLFLFGSVERIKQDAFNAVAVAAPFTAFNGGYIAPFRDNYYVSRGDYNAPKGIHLFARIAYEDNLDDATYGYGFSRYGNKDNTPAIAGGGDFLLGKFTNSLRWSYLKFHNLIADESAGLPNEAAGLPPVPQGIEMFFFTQGLITGPNLLAPQQTYQSDKQFRYDGGTTIRSHQIQFGVSLNRILGGGFASFFGFGPEVDGDFAGGPVGTGSASDPTAYAAADIFLGNGEGYNTEKAEFGSPAGGQGDWRLGVYFGDTWKVNGRLTVNAGVRYSRDTGRSDSDLPPIPCSAAVAVWGMSSPCTTGNLLDSINGQALGSRVRQPNLDFGPKAGFAYDYKGNGKTVIRGGAGLYFENNIFNNILFDRPARLTTGLFWNGIGVNSGASSFNLPTGTTITSINGASLASLWAMPISQSAPYFAAWQALYQQSTKTAGAATNVNYVANSLTEGPVPNGYSMYVPGFRTARSIQINIGVQHQVWKNAVFTADYIRNVGEHFQMSIDENHVGDASHFNATAAANAIANTLAYCNVSSIGAAITLCSPSATGGNPAPTPYPATIADFASHGLDSGNGSFLSSHPAASVSTNPNDPNAPGLTPDTGAAFAGINPLFGQMSFNLPMGRSVYNALQTNLKQGARIPIRGLKGSNFEISYTLSRFISSGGHDQNFTPSAVDNNNPLGYAGPDSQDRTHQLSYGGTFGWVGSIQTSLIGHFYSALPTTLTLDPNGNPPGEIFSSDLTGDGTIGDILPGYKAGAFMRSVKPNQLASVIANYNSTSSGKLTPAGQAVVASGLISAAQMTELGAVTPTIAAPPSNNAGNGSLRTFDLTLARPTKLKWLGESGSVEPNVSIYNLFNFANFNAYSYTSVNKTGGGSLANFQQTGTVNGTDTSLAGRDSFRAGNGSGVFGQGTARLIEYGLKIDF
jgi:hypothetical protein